MVILAAPVGAPESVSELSKVADRVVCLRTPAGFGAIGVFFERFDQVEDQVVRLILSGKAASD